MQVSFLLFHLSLKVHLDTYIYELPACLLIKFRGPWKPCFRIDWSTLEIKLSKFFSKFPLFLYSRNVSGMLEMREHWPFKI